MEGNGRSYSLRKRKRETSRGGSTSLDRVLAAAASCEKVVIFTGSGLSAASGMSTFSSQGGLYERAQKKYRLSEGKKLFTYPFFERQKLDAQAFFAEIYEETKTAVPGKGHYALAAIEGSGRLQRHYTLNVDGLADAVGLSTWQPVSNPNGRTVEMHGSIKQMVCPDPECQAVVEMDDALLEELKQRRDVPCRSCCCDSIRCRIMLYDDKDDECITPDDVFEVLEDDMMHADLVLWVGISFEQSASTHYFRKAREFLLRAGRWRHCVQAIINLSEDAHFNLISACNNIEDIELLCVLDSSDVVLPQIAAVMRRPPLIREAPERVDLPPSPPRPADVEPGDAAINSRIDGKSQRREPSSDKSGGEAGCSGIADPDGHKDRA